MKTAWAVLATLLVLLGLIGVPTWMHLTSHERPKAAQNTPPAFPPKLGE
jgi:hypothetical protein